MKHGSLFSGIGGFDLASEWIGWENVFQVEIDDYCQRVLTKNFPNVKRYRDIKEFKGEKHSVDILTGGFPCQPFSHAGKRKGESDDRYLWPEYLRIIREIQPTYVVGENVAGLISMEDGGTLDGILLDLEGEGYETEQFIIPACGVGAWHRRNRIWIIGYKSDTPCPNPTEPGLQDRGGSQVGERQREKPKPERQDSSRNGVQNATDTEGKRINRKHGNDRKQTGEDGSRTSEFNSNSEDVSNSLSVNDDRAGHGSGTVCGKRSEKTKIQGCDNTSHSKEQGLEGPNPERDSCTEGCPTEHGQRGRETDRGKLESRLGDLVDGLPKELAGYWDREPDIPRVAKGVKERVNKLKGLGNAIAPQVAFEIFKAIQKMDEMYLTP